MKSTGLLWRRQSFCRNSGGAVGTVEGLFTCQTSMPWGFKYPRCSRRQPSLIRPAVQSKGRKWWAGFIIIPKIRPKGATYFLRGKICGKSGGAKCLGPYLRNSHLWFVFHHSGWPGSPPVYHRHITMNRYRCLGP